MTRIDAGAISARRGTCDHPAVTHSPASRMHDVTAAAGAAACPQAEWLLLQRLISSQASANSVYIMPAAVMVCYVCVSALLNDTIHSVQLQLAVENPSVTFRYSETTFTICGCDA